MGERGQRLERALRDHDLRAKAADLVGDRPSKPGEGSAATKRTPIHRDERKVRIIALDRALATNHLHLELLLNRVPLSPQLRR